MDFSLCAQSLLWQAVLSQGWFVLQEPVAKPEDVVVCQIVRRSAGWEWITREAAECPCSENGSEG